MSSGNEYFKKWKRAVTKVLKDSNQTTIHYLGPDPEVGPLPAFIYFALSGEESLGLHPYNQPPKIMNCSNLRIFSFTIPGHEEGMNKFQAMEYWADCMLQGKPIFESFFEKVVFGIRWLIEQKIADPDKLGTGGLSRGGFIATHIAARIPEIRTVLGFAPLTELMHLKEFNAKLVDAEKAKEWNLVHLTSKLAHVSHFRFYIGNLDTRVDTDACYQFIRRLAEEGHEKRLRTQKVELMITQSIGHKGHGTDPHIFEQGAIWAQTLLLSGIGS